MSPLSVRMCATSTPSAKPLRRRDTSSSPHSHPSLSLGDNDKDGVNDSRDPSQKRQKYRNEKLHPTTSLQEDSKRRKENCQQNAHAIDCCSVCHFTLREKCDLI
eukprot:TRINITY_DN24033_c0_g1_i1.p2 TRINITY_DN24033_c0_g1~~TRINITY_DN24033_c0_g1_i1.p2  ORF type:complete len:104 (+),score=1.21 TRINITY_DN24033_c0_g1_i1:718-1029(+)